MMDDNLLLLLFIIIYYFFDCHFIIINTSCCCCILLLFKLYYYYYLLLFFIIIVCLLACIIMIWMVISFVHKISINCYNTVVDEASPPLHLNAITYRGNQRHFPIHQVRNQLTLRREKELLQMGILLGVMYLRVYITSCLLRKCEVCHGDRASWYDEYVAMVVCRLWMEQYNFNFFSLFYYIILRPFSSPASTRLSLFIIVYTYPMLSSCTCTFPLCYSAPDNK